LRELRGFVFETRTKIPLFSMVSWVSWVSRVSDEILYARENVYFFFEAEQGGQKKNGF